MHDAHAPLLKNKFFSGKNGGEAVFPQLCGFVGYLFFNKKAGSGAKPFRPLCPVPDLLYLKKQGGILRTL